MPATPESIPCIQRRSRADRALAGRGWLLAALLPLGLAAQEPARDPVGSADGGAPVPVEVAPVETVLVALERSAPAEVLSLNQSTLSAQIAATVLAIHAEPGQRVNRGDLLLELDPADYRLAVQQAEASLASSTAQREQAEARLRRAQELSGNQYISADDLLARETDVNVLVAQIRVAEAQLELARRNLEKCRITAPFVGVIDERHAQLGDYVVTGSPLLSLTQVDEFELEALVPEAFAASLEAADTIRFDSRGVSWPVRLMRLSPVIARESRVRRARLGFIDSAPEVGRSGELYWTVDRGLLPASLLVRRDGRLGVFLAREGKAVFSPLPEAQEGRPVPASFPPGTRIVTLGRDRLQDGDPILAEPAP